MSCRSLCCLPAPVAVVDLEATGESPRTARIVEVSVRLLDADLRETGAYATLLNPGCDLGPTQVHRIRPHMVRDAPVFADVGAALAAALSGRVVVSHGVGKDVALLNAEMRRACLQALRSPQVCTWEAARAADAGRRTGFTLVDVAARLRVARDDPHRAAADTAMTADVLRALVLDARARHWHLPDPGRRDAGRAGGAEPFAGLVCAPR